MRRLALFLWLFLILSPDTLFAQARSEMTGILIVRVVEDLASNRSMLVHSLQDEATGRVVDLDFLSAGRPASLRSGTRVHAEGTLTRGRLKVEALNLVRPREVAAAPAPAQVGARRVVAILVNMANVTHAANCSKAKVAGELFTAGGSMVRFYQEAAFGQLSFPADSDGNGQPDVFGPFTIPDSTADGEGQVPRFTWIQHAEAAATAAGVDFSRYQHRVFLFPRAGDLPGQAPCTTAWGYLGCANDSCYVAICSLPGTYPSCMLPNVYSHEIGHNLGMHHASVDADDDGTVDTGDNGYEEYGDGSDVMGSGHCGWRDSQLHPNAAHKSQLGWFDAFPGSFLDIDVNGLGPGAVTYTLSAIEPHPDTTADPQLLRLTGGYYLSTRQAVGFDAGIDVPCEFDRFSGWSGRTSVHRLTPDGRSLLVAVLDDGESFTTPRFRAAQMSHGAAAVVLRVEPFQSALFLNHSRFRVDADWQTSNGAAGEGNGVRLTTDTGYFWFFDEQNVEVVVKILNGCALNGRYWVFASGLTNVRTELRITDTQTGATRTYTNPQGTAFQPIQDTGAFGTCP